jgi:hypothetical protein
MGHDDAGQYEWVNAWANAQRPETAAPAAEPAASPAVAPHSAPPTVLRRAPAMAPDQLVRDFVEITRARDALAAAAVKPRTRALTLVPPRTSDAVPVLIGGAMALVLLAVFGAAAAMGKLVR